MSEVIRTISTSPAVVNIEDRLAIDYGLVQILSGLMYTLLLCHWVACAWRWLPSVLKSELDWLTTYSLDYPATVHGQGGELSDFSLYVASLYWAVLTLASIGYGDIVPVNDGERLFAVAVSHPNPLCYVQQ
jgi:hypothetical protein